MTKTYLFIDETGQDTNGKLFIIANLISTKIKSNSSVQITIDALNKKEKMIVKSKLKQFHFSVDKIFGKRDQSDPILRLADALAGFVRDGIEKYSKITDLFERTLKEKIIQEIK